MAAIKLFVAIFFLLFGVACNDTPKSRSIPYAKSNEQEKPSIKFSNYSQVPQKVKDYLDSLNGGQFLIANRGEHWQPGCTVFEGVPQRQFIAASILNNVFEMKYWQGGWGTYQASIKIFLKNEQIAGYEQ